VNEEPVRLFFAIELGDALLDLLDETTAPLRAELPELAWVRREHCHLTLKFLGDVDAASAPKLIEAADVAASRHPPLEMSVRDVGAFPNFRRARVVWIGVEQEPRLELLHHDLELACERRDSRSRGGRFVRTSRWRGCALRCRSSGLACWRGWRERCA
jgi:2'-5' RNA ligase